MLLALKASNSGSSLQKKLRGRELAHVDRGLELVKTMIQQLEEIAKIEREPVKEGRRVIAILAPR